MKAIKERQRCWTTPGASEVALMEREIWHAVPRDAAVDPDWCPILCSVEDGIVCHGGVSTHEITCPDCLAELRRQP